MALYGPTLVALTVGLPIVSGLAALVIPGKKIRSVLVSMTALLLIGSSIALLGVDEFTYNPAHIYEQAVVVLDFALLLYFLYAGIKAKSLPVIGLGLVQIIPAAYFEFIVKGTHVQNIIMVDNLSILLTLIINVVGSVVIIYALSYMEEHEHHLHLDKSRQSRFFFYLILLLGAMNGMVYSNSLYWLYFFWEVTTLCCYELIRHDMTEEAKENSILALWMGLVGGVGFVAAMFVGYNAVHSIALTELMAAPQALMLAFGLIALAAFTKAAQFPWHGWLLGAMVAPTPVSALLHSSTMVNAGIYMLLRIAPAIQGTPLSTVIAFGGAFTFLITAVLAIRQKASKRVLAYSTIGNLGLITLCIGLNTALSYSAAVALLVFHSVAKGLLFMGAGVIENKIGSRNIEDWEGVLGRLPLTATVMIAGMVSMFLPPFGMLLGKWVAVDAIASSPLYLGLPLIIMVVLGSAATTFYYAKWIGYMIVAPNSLAKSKDEQLETPYKLSMVGLLIVDVVISLGAALVFNNIVVPVIKNVYPVVITTPNLSIDLGFTAFPVFALWGGSLAVILIGSWLAKSKGGVLSPPYLGGTNVDNETFKTTADSEVKLSLSWIFLGGSIDEAQYEKAALILGALVTVAMILVGVI
ncbi:NADH-quinone oxidoreductase subunit L [Candidatus Bathyarchaeota archaeon]|jgi:ech hydrogenase subunit A|nr:MAG: NADH-quinone oxidoreductase subunit L [Candidatus Bathyarchaeota archaeon]